MKELNLFIPLTKVDEEKRLVYGIATAEVADLSGEICDYATTKPNYEKWSAEVQKDSGGKSFGNLRAMHGKAAAGKLSSEIVFNDTERQIEICAKVVDDNEWKKVLEGVYTGFSQGGRYVKTWADEKNPALKRYTADPGEVSLVDRACLPIATFQIMKADGSMELRKFAPHPEAAKPETAQLDAGDHYEQVWKSKRSGETFAKKADMIKHHAELDAEAATKGAAAPALAAMAKAEAAMAGKESSGAAAPAKAATKANVPRDMKKSLYNVIRFIEILQSMNWLADNVTFEAALEGDGSALPMQMKAQAQGMVAILEAMIAEETAELFDDAMADDPEGEGVLAAAAAIPAAEFDGLKKHVAATAALAKYLPKIEKAGKRNSKADMENIQVAHDNLVKCGAACGDHTAQKSADQGFSKMALERDSLAKTLSDLAPRIEKMATELEEVKKRAMPPKTAGAFASVSKSQDAPGTGADARSGETLRIEEVQKVLEGMSSDERAFLITKAALANPRVVHR